jgi:hypothetical protein
MSESWNFYMTPAERWQYSNREVSEELAHSIKAYSICGNIAKALAQCRRKPEGGLVFPEKCEKHALAIVDCYQAVKTVPNECSQAFHAATSCLEKHGRCENEMEQYARCDHPAAKLYENYHR